jgi:hypothetical protein
VVVMDISVPTAPRWIRTLDTAGSSRGVAFDGGDALVVADGTLGIVAFDVTSEAEPRLRGTADTNQTFEVAARRGFAFALDLDGSSPFTDAGLKVFDVTATPQAVRFVFLPGLSTAIDLAGDHAFVATGVSGVHVVDVANPIASFHWGTLPVQGQVLDVAVAGNFVVAMRAKDVAILRGVRRTVP